ncbi:IMP dehydrogenase [Oligoflexia bacterium]|nr:IMP dehydrogenase [Oligoflexia bacterium]
MPSEKVEEGPGTEPGVEEEKDAPERALDATAPDPDDCATLAQLLRDVAIKLNQVDPGLHAALEIMPLESRVAIADSLGPIAELTGKAFQLTPAEVLGSIAQEGRRPHMPYVVSFTDFAAGKKVHPAYALSYVDVTVEPAARSYVESRDEPKYCAEIVKGVPSFPLTPSNMSTVLSEELALAVRREGGYPFIHRFMDWDFTKPGNMGNLTELINRLDGQCFYVVGGTHDDQTEVKTLLSAIHKMQDAGLFGVCVDIANGTNEIGLRSLRVIKKEFGDTLKLGGGNVATFDQARVLVEHGVDLIKAGIGSGSMCITPIKTGMGKPLITTILEVAAAARPHGVSVMADQAIREPGEVVKAMVAGANAGAMMGGLYARSEEAAGEIFTEYEMEDGQQVIREGHPVIRGRYRIYAGEASNHARERRGMKSDQVAEGAQDRVPVQYSVEEFHDEVTGSMQSAMTYGNIRVASSLDQCRLVVVSPSYRGSEMVARFANGGN